MLTESLKHHTRAAHGQLEEINPLPRSREDYIRQLIAFYGFVEPWERKLAEALPASDPIRSGRAKTPWLEADLDHFGFDAARRAQLRRTDHLPETTSRVEILGAAYVLEGATLGGQIIARHVESALGLSNGNGYAFFRSYGSEVGTKWQAFRTELLRSSSPGDDPLIVAAAQNTFALLYRWFARRAELFP